MADQSVVRASDRAFVSNPSAAPGNDETVVLFATHPRKPGGSGAAVMSSYTRGHGTDPVNICPDAIEHVRVTWVKHDKASAANGLRAYQTDDGGATWHETDMKNAANVASIGAAAPIQIPVLSAGQVWAEDFDVGRYRGFAIEETAGATGPTPVTGWKYIVAVEYCAQGGR